MQVGILKILNLVLDRLKNFSFLVSKQRHKNLFSLGHSTSSLGSFCLSYLKKLAADWLISRGQVLRWYMIMLKVFYNQCLIKIKYHMNQFHNYLKNWATVTFLYSVNSNIWNNVQMSNKFPNVIIIPFRSFVSYELSFLNRSIFHNLKLHFQFLYYFSSFLFYFIKIFIFWWSKKVNSAIRRSLEERLRFSF